MRSHQKVTRILFRVSKSTDLLPKTLGQGLPDKDGVEWRVSRIERG